MSANPETKTEFKPEIIEILNKKTGEKKPFLPAHDAITWFRTDYPGLQSRIATRIEDIEKKIILCEIYIRDDDGQYALVSTARSAGDGDRSLEKLETAAIRRALAYLGYGTVAAMAEDSGNAALTAEEAANVAAQTAKTTPDEKRAMMGNGGQKRYNSQSDSYQSTSIQFTNPEFDGSYFYSTISPLFKAIKHRDNALAKMFREGLLKADMEADDAIKAVFDKYGPEATPTTPAQEADDDR